ncbi:hypothetical protein Pmar_PMAR020722 [Perkinsus marinus ATCC 50983]|uniref:Uncharacterized protein n=1 Tax=Perkinsus marinus (strain ATCC 50983 / TXsc) TaxID=423536 RepID=C5KVY0_PERM5|nr:hypothetical protein Pmar_PMAR020722 [Perkinsus marinus ATCC 50983]EER11371.1 hypothetical protein Pmar_PMAR020722 [Perkinsus marinus ATCC 50983]|eukprot:XP_002779576.1 hypothetical protein Pmar_PMAR020722 [Perkinsus marinus ATCC 50983]
MNIGRPKAVADAITALPIPKNWIGVGAQVNQIQFVNRYLRRHFREGPENLSETSLRCIGISPTAQAIRAPARVNCKLVDSHSATLLGVTPMRDLQYHTRDEVQKALGHGSIPGTNDPSLRIYHLLPITFPAHESLWTSPDPLVTDVIKVSRSTEPHRLGTLIYNRCRDGEEDITVVARGDIALAMAVRSIAKAAAKLVSFEAKRLVAIPVTLKPKSFQELQISIRWIELPPSSTKLTEELLSGGKSISDVATRSS